MVIVPRMPRMVDVVFMLKRLQWINNEIICYTKSVKKFLIETTQSLT